MLSYVVLKVEVELLAAVVPRQLLCEELIVCLGHDVKSRLPNLQRHSRTHQCRKQSSAVFFRGDCGSRTEEEASIRSTND